MGLDFRVRGLGFRETSLRVSDVGETLGKQSTPSPPAACLWTVSAATTRAPGRLASRMFLVRQVEHLGRLGLGHSASDLGLRLRV